MEEKVNDEIEAGCMQGLIQEFKVSLHRITIQGNGSRSFLSIVYVSIGKSTCNGNQSSGANCLLFSLSLPCSLSLFFLSLPPSLSLFMSFFVSLSLSLSFSGSRSLPHHLSVCRI